MPPRPWTPIVGQLYSDLISWFVDPLHCQDTAAVPAKSKSATEFALGAPIMQAMRAHKCILSLPTLNANLAGWGPDNGVSKCNLLLTRQIVHIWFAMSQAQTNIYTHILECALVIPDHSWEHYLGLKPSKHKPFICFILVILYVVRKLTKLAEW